MNALLAQSLKAEEAVAEATRRATSVVTENGAAEFRTQWRAFAEVGVLADSVPTGADRNNGLGPVTRAVTTIEGIGRAGAPAGLCYAIASQRFGLQFPLRTLVPDETWSSLGPVERGEIVLCHALTEEGGGSDPLSMATCATRQDDGSYVLTGRKAFVTAAPVADVALVFARTSPGPHPFALSAFLVDLHIPGISQSAPFAKTTLIDVPMGAVDFDGARVAADRLIGEEGSGLALLATTTTWERALLLCYALGPMWRVLDRTTAWVKSREHFGRRMGASHLVAARVSDMALALFRCRRLLYDIAQRFDSGVRPSQLAIDAALTKISVAEDYLTFTRQATMLGGVRSFIEESGLTADVTGPMAASIYAGPNDLLRISVARGLGLPVEN